MQTAIEETPHTAVAVPSPASETRRGWLARTGAAVSAAIGAVTGAAPHVLHHVGPLAGAAVVGGATGTFLFGSLGFVLALPMLYQLRRRFGNWTAPAIALAIFAVMFTISTLWIGPAIRGDGAGVPGVTPVDHASHHGG